MDRQDVGNCHRQPPDDAAETDDDQGAIYQGREQNFAELRRDVALKDISYRVEFRIVRVTDEVWGMRLALRN